MATVTGRIASIRKHLSDPLNKNSYFLIGASALTAILGSIFWLVVARFYTSSEVGTATALISAVGLLATFSKLGFDWGILRFVSQDADKRQLVNTSFTLVAMFSLCLTIICVLGASLWSPALLNAFENNYIYIFFVLFTVCYSIWMLQQNIYVGMRYSKISFSQNLMIGMAKIPLPIIAVSFGVSGLFISWGLPLFAATLLGLFVYTRRIIPDYFPCFTINRHVANKIGRFSIHNYIAESFDSAPVFLLPIIVISVISPEANAYFYVDWIIITGLIAIIMAVSASLLAELAFDSSRLQADVRRAVKLAAMILLPSLTLVNIFAAQILSLFGAEYSSNGITLLRILSLATVPIVITRLYVTVKRIQLKMRPVITVYAANALLTVVLSYGMAKYYGLEGMGVGYLLAQCLVGVVVLYVVLFGVKKKDNGTERQDR